jgi:hypothetical protein
VKSRFSSLLASNSFTVDDLSLVYWAQAESTICIIAASIPHLRILFCEPPNLYFRTASITDVSQTTQPNSSSRKTGITCSGQGCSERPALDKMTDNISGNKSILNYDIEMNGIEGLSIAQLTDFGVEYRRRNDSKDLEESGSSLETWGHALRRTLSDI